MFGIMDLVFKCTLVLFIAAGASAVAIPGFFIFATGAPLALLLFSIPLLVLITVISTKRRVKLANLKLLIFNNDDDEVQTDVAS